MKKILVFIIIIMYSHTFAQNLLIRRHSFMQANNINTIFYNDGVYNYDKYTFPGGDAGFIWPVSATSRMTADFTTGLFIGAKVGPQRELRLAASFFNSHYTPGNIPVMGQVPPQSVCSDTSWTVYLVNLNDPALVNGGTRTKVAGGRSYIFYYSSWAQWPIAKGAPYAEVNGIPGYQPGWNSDRPGIGNGSRARPEEICFAVFMDYTNCTNNIHHSELSLPGGTLPLGVEIHQISFAFNCPVLSNMYFVKYRLVNKSLLNWDSAYLSIMNDPDLGDAFDDSFGCDSTKNLSFVYNGDNSDQIYGSNPPAIGTRFLQCPVLFTGNPGDTAKLPYDTLIGFKLLNMSSSFKYENGGDPCYGNPEEAIQAYNFMRGLNACGNPYINRVTGQPTHFQFNGDACHRIGWFDSVQSSRWYIQNTGPFHMNSGDTQIVVASFIITRDGGTNFQNVCALQNLSDTALKYYFNDFRTCIPIGIEPISNQVPDRFILYQNYPNPFNPLTVIKFAIPPSPKGEGLGVRVVIYDILGREITTLVNEELKPGTYEVEWPGDAKNYPSGVYFYQLTAPGFTQTNKMVLLK